MTFDCVGVTGYAGDRTPEGMLCCHDFAEALSSHFGWSCKLAGSPQSAKDLRWDDAIVESKITLETIVSNLNRILSSGHKPILVTPRCAAAIASIPVITMKYPDVVVLWFDAHGDLNTPETSNSGYLGGMPITAVLGEWESGYGSGLKLCNLVHIGGRDFDPAESAFIKTHGVTTLSKQDIEGELKGLQAVIKDKLVYIHLDTDVFDPDEVTADYAIDDGLFRKDVKRVIDLVLQEAELVGIEITELSPRNLAECQQSYSAIFESFDSLRVNRPTECT